MEKQIQPGFQGSENSHGMLSGSAFDAQGVSNALSPPTFQLKAGSIAGQKKQALYPYKGVILKNSSALRYKPFKDPQKPYDGISKDLPLGIEVSVIGKSGNWLKVQVALGGASFTGYVSQELVRKTQDTRASPKEKKLAGQEAPAEVKPSWEEVDLGKEGVKAYKLIGSAMMPFVSGDKTLSEAGKDMDKKNATEFTLNAQFLEGGFLSGYNNQGKSYANGKSLGGSSQKEWHYIDQNAAGNYNFGVGDPPKGARNAVGGGRPVVVDGLAYGIGNKYSKDAPEGLKEKTTGSVAAKDRKYLTQKNAAYFPAQNSSTKGKSLVGYNPSTKALMIIVQEDGKKGYSLDAFRDYLMKKGYTNVLSFDGSDSAMLIKDKNVLINNGWGKDRNTDSGITFSVPNSK